MSSLSDPRAETFGGITSSLAWRTQCASCFSNNESNAVTHDLRVWYVRTFARGSWSSTNESPGSIKSTFAGNSGFGEEEDEPPLLEELGIDPDRIMQKTLAVLNPFHRRGQIDDASYLLQDSDLAGPVAFCLVLAAFLLLAGSKAHFGYVYGLALTSCILMYILLSLMSTNSNVTLSSVASVLGYCLLPVVVLAAFSVFATLRGPIGLLFATLTVSWAALSASRLFSTMSGELDQQLLIAYPCLLLYGVFTLIIIF